MAVFRNLLCSCSIETPIKAQKSKYIYGHNITIQSNETSRILCSFLLNFVVFNRIDHYVNIHITCFLAYLRYWVCVCI